MPWPFVRRWNTNREGVVAGPPSPLAIFDQYYKNQPTDFLRKILPPCVAEYFIGVHPGTHPPPIPFLFQLPALARRRGCKHRGQRKEIGRGSGTRFSFCFVACGRHSWNAIFQWGTFLRSIWNLFAIFSAVCVSPAWRTESAFRFSFYFAVTPLDRWRFVSRVQPSTFANCRVRQCVYSNGETIVDARNGHATINSISFRGTKFLFRRSGVRFFFFLFSFFLFLMTLRQVRR